MMGQYEEHVERYDGADDDQDTSEESSMSVRAVDGEVVEGGTATVRRAHS